MPEDSGAPAFLAPLSVSDYVLVVDIKGQKQLGLVVTVVLGDGWWGTGAPKAPGDGGSCEFNLQRPR